MERTVIKIAGLLLGLFLVVTGLGKAIAIGEFASGIVREMQIPQEFGIVCAVAIVATEVITGAGLYFRRTRRLSGALAALLFFLFTLLILRKIIEGSEFQCNCFGISTLRLPLPHHLVLDLALTIVALLVALRPTVVPNRYSSSHRLTVALLAPILVGVFFLGWVLFSAFRSPSTTAAPEEKKTELDIAFPVKVSRAVRGTLIKGVTSSGLLRPVRMVELIAEVSGEIISVSGYEGKAIEKGEIVAAMDRTEFRLAYERAASTLLAAQIEYRTLSASPFLQISDTVQARRDLEAARENYQRVRTAYAAGRIDGPAFVRARREYEAARAYYSVNREDVIANRSGLVQAREAYERARRDLEATEIKAPFAGVLASWDAAVGMHARMGHTLCSLVDISKILLDADIVEGEAAQVHPGQGAVVTCMAYPEDRFGGKISVVSPLIDTKTRMLRVTIELFLPPIVRDPSSYILRPGMFASVLIETERQENRLLLPREALLTRDLRKLVFTMEDGLAKWHYVETGEENREFIEIRSGLSAGDTIIVSGHQALAHDARVFVKE